MTGMIYRKAAASDADGIMRIIRQAQAYLKEQGVNQWQNDYPNPATVKNDIDRGFCYVMENGCSIAGTVAVVFDGEKTYDRIYCGSWLSGGKYATIHRIAVDSGLKGSGLASRIIGNIEEMCKSRAVHSIRVDTHRDNRSMRRLLEKNGFIYCGIIYLADGSERVAFEKLLHHQDS